MFGILKDQSKMSLKIFSLVIVSLVIQQSLCYENDNIDLSTVTTDKTFFPDFKFLDYPDFDYDDNEDYACKYF